MVKKLFKFTYFIFLVFLLVRVCPGQLNDSEKEISADSCLSVTSAIIRSVLIPGTGQLYQERLGHAAFFYGASAVLYYNTFFYLYRYNKTDYINYKNKFQSNLSAAIFFHLLNIIDVSDAALHDCPKGWQGELLSDRPVKSPWGAVLRSGIFPGWGQVYNKSYLKAVGYLAVDGFLFYKIRENDIRYRSTKNTNFRDQRSKYSWYFGLAYMLTMADAYAGAYLYKFEQAMEMTILPEIDGEYLGIKLYVHLF